MKFDKQVAEKIKNLKEQIAKAKICNEDLVLAKSVMPKDTHFWIDYEVNCSWAVKSISEVKDVLREFAKKGVMLDYLLESESQPSWKLKGKNAGIRLTPVWATSEEAQGATCKLVKIGEEVVTYPKWKLVCDNDPSDMVI